MWGSATFFFTALSIACCQLSPVAQVPAQALLFSLVQLSSFDSVELASLFDSSFLLLCREVAFQR